MTELFLVLSVAGVFTFQTFSFFMRLGGRWSFARILSSQQLHHWHSVCPPSVFSLRHPPGDCSEGPFWWSGRASSTGITGRHGRRSSHAILPLDAHLFLLRSSPLSTWQHNTRPVCPCRQATWHQHLQKGFFIVFYIICSQITSAVTNVQFLMCSFAYKTHTEDDVV